MPDPITLARNIELAPGKEPPKEFRLFSAGVIETSKGTFLFDEMSQAAVTAKASDRGTDYPVDYDHAMMSMFDAASPDQRGKAAGWFKPVVRAGELWATDVSWTPNAARMLSDREYRYCSPAFRTDDDGRINELLNVALTNLPATKRIDPLMASTTAGKPGPKEQSMKIVLSKLGLSETATEAEALAVVTSLSAVVDQVSTLTGAKTTAEIIGTLTAWKANEAKVVALSTELAGFKSREVESEIEKLIATGKSDGKINPSSEGVVRQLAKDHGAPALKQFLAAAMSAPKPIGEPEKGDASGLTPIELAAATKHKVDIKKLAETKAAAIAAGTYPVA